MTREGNVLLRYDRTLLPDVPGQRRTPGSAFEVTVNGSPGQRDAHGGHPEVVASDPREGRRGPMRRSGCAIAIPSSNPVRSSKIRARGRIQEQGGALCGERTSRVRRDGERGAGRDSGLQGDDAAGAGTEGVGGLRDVGRHRDRGGMDYTATSGTLIFEVGEVHKRISVPVIDDSDEDSGETFTLTLSNPINAFVGDAISDRDDLQPRSRGLDRELRRVCRRRTGASRSSCCSSSPSRSGSDGRR